jgi:ribonuclease E
VAEVAEGPKMRRRPRARAAAAAVNIAEAVADAAPKARRGRKPRAVEADAETVAPEPVVPAPISPEPVAAEPAAPKPGRRRREAVAEATMDEVSATPAETIEASAPKPKRARRKASDAVVEAPAVEEAVVEEAPAKVAKPRGRPRKAAVVDAGDAAPTGEPLAEPIATTTTPTAPPAAAGGSAPSANAGRCDQRTGATERPRPFSFVGRAIVRPHDIRQRSTPPVATANHEKLVSPQRRGPRLGTRLRG